MEKIPIIDIGKCNLCMSCVENFPEIFKKNSLEFIEIIQLHNYSENDVNTAIKYCPQKCINWN